MNPTDDTFFCPECDYENSRNTNIEDEEDDLNRRTYRCGKCEHVFNTTEYIIPGTIRPPTNKEGI